MGATALKYTSSEEDNNMWILWSTKIFCQTKWSI